VRALLASPLGFLIGISLGALGGGGSILAIPALVYAAGQAPKAATTTSLVLVAITAAVGIVPHWRAGRVRVAAGTAFGVVGVGGSLLGTRLNSSVNQDLLLLLFSGLMLIAAGAMWRRVRRAETGVSVASKRPAAETVSLTGTPDGIPMARARAISVVKVLVAGSFVGMLTGFFGVGGGFVIVPALVLALDFDMIQAAGTSLLVITINSVVALTSRLQGGSIEWRIVVPFVALSLLGVMAGNRLAGSKSPAVLQKWFAGLLVTVAVYTAVRSGIALG